MYHKGRKVYRGRYEYRGYYVTFSTVYGWTVFNGTSMTAQLLVRGLSTKQAAYRHIDSIFNEGGDYAR